MQNLKDNPIVPQSETPGVDGEYIGRDDSNKILEGEWIEAPVVDIVRGGTDSESVIVIHGEMGEKIALTKDQVNILMPQLFKFIHPERFPIII